MQQSESAISVQRERADDNFSRMRTMSDVIDFSCEARCRRNWNASLQFTTHMSCYLHILSALAALMATTMSARADAVTQREDQFKAAYVFNFVRFVEWPSGVAAETVRVCFVGGAGVYQALTTGIDNKRVGSRRLAALQLTHSAPVDACHAVYIEAALASSYNFANEPVLTISDAAGFAANGGMIQLFTENHRLRFFINVDNAQRAGLRISSDLLKLAAGVQREQR